MRTLIKSLLLLPFTIASASLGRYAIVLNGVRTRLGQEGLDLLSADCRNGRLRISHRTQGKVTTLQLKTPNALNLYRAQSFSEKEPETLRWIDEHGGDGPLFDIGANVGLYSIYYARTKGADVYAFEPSVFNLGLLAQNAYLNGVQKQIHIVPNPLTERRQFSEFTLSSTEEGGALSAFGVSYGYDGKSLKEEVSYRTLGFSLDELIDQGTLPVIPRLIKLDVDGIEHLILRGAKKTLAHPLCRSVLVEVCETFREQASEVEEILTGAGFKLTAIPQRHAGDSLGTTGNQIWLKT